MEAIDAVISGMSDTWLRPASPLAGGSGSSTPASSWSLSHSTVWRGQDDGALDDSGYARRLRRGEGHQRRQRLLLALRRRLFGGGRVLEFGDLLPNVGQGEHHRGG